MTAEINSISEHSKKVADSIVEQTHLLFPSHLNSYGRLFGGQLMMWIDEVAGLVARKHCETRIATAAVDNLQFKSGAKDGDILVLKGHITYAGNTSVEVEVDTYVVSAGGIGELINRAYVVEVSVDENMMPIRAPRLELCSPDEFAQWENAKKRNELRKRRRLEGF